jgi:hypothetical protein
MKKIDMSAEAIERRLREVDQLHELSIALLRTGMDHYRGLVAEGKAPEKSLAHFRKYLVDRSTI